MYNIRNKQTKKTQNIEGVGAGREGETEREGEGEKERETHSRNSFISGAQYILI